MSLEEIFEKDKVSFQQIFNRILLLKYRYRGFFPSDNVKTLDKDPFAIIITQASNMQGEPWVNIANSRHKLYFADSLGITIFLKQQYKQMMAESLQSHPSVCGLYAIYQAFHLSKFGPEKIIGVHIVGVLYL